MFGFTHKSFILSSLAFQLLSTLSCHPESQSSSRNWTQSELANANGLGKADSFWQPIDHGEFKLGANVRGKIGENQWFHSWTFTLSKDAEISLAVESLTPNLDTVLYLFRWQKEKSSWGDFIFKNDDCETTSLGSCLTESLQTGTYRVIVKPFKTAMFGDFLLTSEVRGTYLACNDGWMDAKTGLCWENPPADHTLVFNQAKTYCDSIGEGWRLPTINELMTLIRGCDQLGCKLRDPDCLKTDCYKTCVSCEVNWGPGPNGVYWPDGVVGNGSRPYWSSSSDVTEGTQIYYTVNYSWGAIFPSEGGSVNQQVRCVRTINQ